jgi:hypothetical protein
MSPRSAIERRKAVDRARGGLHNANTAMSGVYRPRRHLTNTAIACCAEASAKRVILRLIVNHILGPDFLLDIRLTAGEENSPEGALG